MSHLLLLLAFVFTAQTGDTTAPPDADKGLSISVTGKVELPADQVQFNINVNAEADTPQAAYELHQKREKALVELLDEYDINEENIRYEPVSISKSRNNYNRGSDEKPFYRTQQSVNVTFENFEIYEKIQIGLIENGFDNFNGSFGSTKHEEGKAEALRKAIQQAKEKAQIMAEEAGVELGQIVDMSYNYQQARPYAADTMQMKASASESGSMLKFNQSITISATVSLRFNILSNPDK
jgi:uncharacterized protein YggE